jgi:hypothetical protein
VTLPGTRPQRIGSRLKRDPDADTVFHMTDVPISAVHDSSSHENKAAEIAVIDVLRERPGLATLRPKTVELATGIAINVDAVTDADDCFVEVLAHHGKLVGGQKRKVAMDILKLVAVHERYPDAQLLVALTGHQAARSVAGWVRFVAESNGIQIEAVELGQEWELRLEAARAKQTRGMRQIKRT